MNYKRNTRYFTAALLGRLATVCWVTAAVCVAVVFLRLGWWLYLLGGTLAFIAVICGFFFSSYSVKDSEYDSLCKSLELAFHARFTEFVSGQLNKNNGRGKAPIVVDEEKVAYSRSFLYDQNTPFRVGQDGRRRSGKYSMTACLFGKQTLFLGYEVHGLTAELHEEIFGAYPFSEIEDITSERPETLHPLAEYKRVQLRLKGRPTPVEFWKADDAELDALLQGVRARRTASE